LKINQRIFLFVFWRREKRPQSEAAHHCRLHHCHFCLFHQKFDGLINQVLYHYNNKAKKMMNRFAQQVSRSSSNTILRSRPSARWLSTSGNSSLKDAYDYIKVEKRADIGVGLLTLDRPKALNALCDGLFADLLHAARALDDDDEIGCMVLTGSQKAFAAGADISEMSTKTFDHTYKKNMFVGWADFGKLSKPVIAAVNGFALGGGCELAMMCDIMVAGDKAKFGQPEINLGVLPGAGGTQRLTRAIGKSKAMYMCLTGEMISAQEAELAGLVAKIFPADNLVEEAVKIAQKIAAKGHMAAIMTKEAVNASQELSLQEGLRFERRLFHSLFATADQKEGMAAFLEKREAKFQNK
jgi:enoyl-CoA hydratase/carnithine racemase